MEKIKIIAISLSVAALGAVAFMGQAPVSKAQTGSHIEVVTMPLAQTFAATGVIKPRNRLEVRPPVAGRLETILVDEGQEVKAGQTVATMSSNERATLLDAARAKGDEELKYWQEAYRAIPLIAPMDATVIVATIKPGQSLAAIDPVVVLADELIVQAQVDETDIGKVKVGMKATVTLDAYAESSLPATVERVYYESTTISNVTVYVVDLKISPVPEYFRSGMNAQVSFEIFSNPAARVLPLEAVNLASAIPTVTILDAKGKEETVEIKVGITTDQWVEIISGIPEGATVVIKEKSLSLEVKNAGKNPFMPAFRQRDAKKTSR